MLQVWVPAKIWPVYSTQRTHHPLEWIMGSLCGMDRFTTASSWLILHRVHLRPPSVLVFHSYIIISKAHYESASLVNLMPPAGRWMETHVCSESIGLYNIGTLTAPIATSRCVSLSMYEFTLHYFEPSCYVCACIRMQSGFNLPWGKLPPEK